MGSRWSYAVSEPCPLARQIPPGLAIPGLHSLIFTKSAEEPVSWTVTSLRSVILRPTAQDIFCGRTIPSQHSLRHLKSCWAILMTGIDMRIVRAECIDYAAFTSSWFSSPIPDLVCADSDVAAPATLVHALMGRLSFHEGRWRYLFEVPGADPADAAERQTSYRSDAAP